MPLTMTTQKFREFFGIGMKKHAFSIDELAATITETNILMNDEAELTHEAPVTNTPNGSQTQRSYLNDLYMHTDLKIREDR